MFANSVISRMLSISFGSWGTGTSRKAQVKSNPCLKENILVVEDVLVPSAPLLQPVQAPEGRVLAEGVSAVVPVCPEYAVDLEWWP